MWQLLKGLKRHLGFGHSQKSSRVTDESVVGSAVINQDHRRGVGNLSALLAIVRAPLAITCCLVGQMDGMEEVRASGEQLQIANIDRLMMRDSMLYAIYV